MRGLHYACVPAIVVLRVAVGNTRAAHTDPNIRTPKKYPTATAEKIPTRALPPNDNCCLKVATASVLLCQLNENAALGLCIRGVVKDKLEAPRTCNSSLARTSETIAEYSRCNDLAPICCLHASRDSEDDAETAVEGSLADGTTEKRPRALRRRRTPASSVPSGGRLENSLRRSSAKSGGIPEQAAVPRTVARILSRAATQSALSEPLAVSTSTIKARREGALFEITMALRLWTKKADCLLLGAERESRVQLQDQPQAAPRC